MTTYRATSTGGASTNLEAKTLDAAKKEAAAWASYGNTITLWADGEPVADYPFVEGGFAPEYGPGARHYTHGPWEDC